MFGGTIAASICCHVCTAHCGCACISAASVSSAYVVTVGDTDTAFSSANASRSCPATRYACKTQLNETMSGTMLPPALHSSRLCQ